VLRIISSSAWIKNSIPVFSPTTNVLGTFESWYVAVIVQIPLRKSSSIFIDVVCPDVVCPVISFFFRASWIL